MPYQASVYKIMIASPSDVSLEREKVREAIHEWNYVHSEDRSIVLMPVGWDTHSFPAMGERPQAIINKQILAKADLLVAVFWTRLGSPTGKAASGTVEEIEEHLAAGKPAMIYFSSAPVRLESVDAEQYAALLRFKEECQKRGLVQTYESISEFRDKLVRQLAQTVIQHFGGSGSPDEEEVSGELGTTRSPIPLLSNEAKILLMEASQDRTGTVLMLRSTGGLTVQTNSRNLVESQEPRVQAMWEEAVRELRDNQLLQDKGYKGEVYSVTSAGFRVADLLREQESSRASSK